MGIRSANREILEIRKENAKSVLKKLITGVYAILVVGIITYLFLFLTMIIM